MSNLLRFTEVGSSLSVFFDIESFRVWVELTLFTSLIYLKYPVKSK